MPRRPPRTRPTRRHDQGVRRRQAKPNASRRRDWRLLAVGLVVLSLLGATSYWAFWRPSDSAQGELATGSESARATAKPAISRSWLQQIDDYRAEDRPIKAMAVGWSAYASVSPEERRDVLRALTLALLADVPEEQARAALQHRIDANPDDLDARVALIRLALNPEALPANRPRIGRAPDPSAAALVELEKLLEQHPIQSGARAALIDALLDAGQIDRARTVLDEWPADHNDDPRWLRLKARFDLEFDARPDQAAAALSRLLDSTPHDWRLRARLSRALQMQGDSERAKREATLVDRLRERLDPSRLGPRLAHDLERLDDPDALSNLAAICASVGLVDLAAAWRLEASRASGSTADSLAKDG